MIVSGADAQSSERTSGSTINRDHDDTTGDA